MAEDRRAAFHQRALKSPGLSDEARAYHQGELDKRSAASKPASQRAAPQAPHAADTPPDSGTKTKRSSNNAALAASEEEEEDDFPVHIGGDPHQFPPHSGFVGGRPAVSEQRTPAQGPSAAATYIATHAHLHQDTEPTPRPAPKPRSPISRTPEQMAKTVEYHEDLHRRAVDVGDVRAAKVHADKAQAMREAMQVQGHPLPSTPARAGRAVRVVNPEVERNRVEAKQHAARATESRMHASQHNEAMTEHLHRAAQATDPNERAAHNALAATARAAAARHRAEAAGHQANSAESNARAAQAQGNDDEKARQVALAARHRATGARFNQQASENRAQTAQHRADTAVSGGTSRNTEAVRHAKLKRASKEFHDLLQTGSHTLIEQMRRQVG